MNVNRAGVRGDTYGAGVLFHVMGTEEGERGDDANKIYVAAFSAHLAWDDLAGKKPAHQFNILP